MTDDQAERLISAIEGLATAFEKVARPTVIVTDDEDCALVNHYRRHGYPVYFPERTKVAS